MQPMHCLEFIFSCRGEQQCAAIENIIFWIQILARSPDSLPPTPHCIPLLPTLKQHERGEFLIE